MARSSIEKEAMRVYVLMGLMLSAFAFLALMLWRIQVAQGHQYERDELRQSLRRVRLPGTRGLILDRQGHTLADNRPSYSVAIYLEEIRQPGPWTKTLDHVETILDQLAIELGRPRTITRQDIQNHRIRRLPLPLIAWRDLDDTHLARWAERASAIPGVDIFTETVRVYPHGPAAGHVLGYVGRADPIPDEAEPYHYYLPEMEGKAGLERRLDARLKGEPGGRLVRVDVIGYRHGDVAVRKPTRGQDVQLTLDIELQEAASRIMGDTPGAVVVLDVRNGDVLALVSAPGFDPNHFIPSISVERWRGLLDDKRNPLLNRAAAGAFAPGSIFKPVVAVAALENKAATPDQVFNCPGSFTLGSARPMHCWARHGHGPLNMRESLQHSCNVYYFRLALMSGYDAIYHTAEAMGLGHKTGIILDHEVGGIVPNDAWKRRVYQDAWRDGDTCNVSIGQGPITVTPLQMAVVAAALGNGGRVFTPRIIQAIRDRETGEMIPEPAAPVRDLDWSPRTIATVQGGMRDAVMAPNGTARLAQVPGIEVAGKTGTAEFGRKEEDLKHAWMIAFAPMDNPRYAVALLTDEGVSGGQTAAPKVGQLLRYLFDREQPYAEAGS